MANKEIKSRYWGFVMYPPEYNDPENPEEQTGGRPKDWRTRLELTGLPMAISPLHNLDTDPDETEKKPHYHVLIAYSNSTTGANIERISKSVNGSRVIPIQSAKGMYDYHLHINNPEKYPYWQDPEKHPRILLNGFNIEDYATLTDSEKAQLFKIVFSYIRENMLFEYADLLDFLESEDIQAFRFACNNTITIDSYLRSRRNKVKQKENFAQESKRKGNKRLK